MNGRNPGYMIPCEIAMDDVTVTVTFKFSKGGRRRVTRHTSRDRATPEWLSSAFFELNEGLSALDAAAKCLLPYQRRLSDGEA